MHSSINQWPNFFPILSGKFSRFNSVFRPQCQKLSTNRRYPSGFVINFELLWSGTPVVPSCPNSTADCGFFTQRRGWLGRSASIDSSLFPASFYLLLRRRQGRVIIIDSGMKETRNRTAPPTVSDWLMLYQSQSLGTSGWGKGFKNIFWGVCWVCTSATMLPKPSSGSSQKNVHKTYSPTCGPML